MLNIKRKNFFNTVMGVMIAISVSLMMVMAEGGFGLASKATEIIGKFQFELDAIVVPLAIVAGLYNIIRMFILPEQGAKKAQMNLFMIGGAFLLYKIWPFIINALNS